MNSPRRFFLEAPLIEGAPRLLPEEQQHALKVLRVEAGDRILGLDGLGLSLELEIERADRQTLELKACGPPTRHPAPGAAEASLPWIEVCCPLPKGNRAESMVGRLTQLGLARLRPLISERTEVQAREFSEGRSSKLRRTAREALKQCGRAWLPRIEASSRLGDLIGKPGLRVLLDPGCETPLSELLARSLPEGPWSELSPLVLIAGPEGGFSPAEHSLLLSDGIHPARVSAQILRIETAVEAALAISAEAYLGRP